MEGQNQVSWWNLPKNKEHRKLHNGRISVQNQFYCYYSILQKSPNHIFIQQFIVAEGYCWLVSYDYLGQGLELKFAAPDYCNSAGDLTATCGTSLCSLTGFSGRRI